MKTIILIIIVAIIAFFALRSVYRMFTGKGGCSCGDGGKCSSGGCSCGIHSHGDTEHKCNCGSHNK